MKSEFDAGEVSCTQVHIQMPTKQDPLSLPTTKRNLIFILTLVKSTLNNLIHISVVKSAKERKQWELVAFSGPFGQLNLYQYPYHHINSPEGEWVVGLISAKFPSRDETGENLVAKIIELFG